MIKKIIIIWIGSLQIANASHGYAAQAMRIATHYLQEHQVEEHISALAITIQTTESPKPLTLVLGQTQTAVSPRLTKDHLFQIGSITKSFLAAALLQLAANPKLQLHLDDHIDKYFPEYPHWHDITIRQLMNMTSGIPDPFTKQGLFEEYARLPYQWHNHKQWMNSVYHQRLHFQPGTAFDYSNSNYILLELLVERLTHQSLQTVITKHFIKPLHLQHTYYTPHQIDGNLLPYMVHGYQQQTGFANDIPLHKDVTHYSLSYLGGAGAMWSTTEDVTKWLHALFTPGKVLTTAQLQQLVEFISEKTGQPQAHLNKHDADGYGLGVSARYSAKLTSPVYIYFGMTLGYRTIYLYVPTRHMSIVISVNSGFDVDKNHLLTLLDELSTTIN